MATYCGNERSDEQRMTPLTASLCRFASFILSTDMADHFAHVAHLNKQVESVGVDLANENDACFVIGMMLHAGDVSNPTKNWDYYNLWTERVMKEFFAQGRKEKELGMRVSDVTLMKQEKVAAIMNNEGGIAQSESDPFEIESKPHGHGDVHSLMHSNGLPQKWLDMGLEYAVFFQDTNGLGFHTLAAFLGVSKEVRKVVRNERLLTQEAKRRSTANTPGRGVKRLPTTSRTPPSSCFRFLVANTAPRRSSTSS